MTKLIIPIINLLIIATLQVFQGSVSVKMDVPLEVNAGSEFTVKVTFEKGNLESFSRFQQNIPTGLTAISETSSNADFTFSDKRVRLIWLRIPRNDEITVTYRIKVDEKLKGNFFLAGRFSYIDNNERKSVDIDPVSITIIPSANIDPSLIVDINDFEKIALPVSKSPAEESENIACFRQKPVQGEKGEYLVNILVNKESMQKFAKIEEDVPEGFTAVAIDAKDAIFTFKSQKVKFLWMNLPMEPYFTVSYRLIPKNQAKLPLPIIRGSFSYLIEDKTISINIVEKDLTLANLSQDDIRSLIVQAKSEPVPSVEQPVVEKNLAVAEKEMQSQPVEEVKPVEQPREKQVKITVKANGNHLLEPEQGVYYRIQIAAGHKPINIDHYFRKLKLDKEILKETHDGWQKYSVGSFALYKDARDYRVHIWNTTPVKDAFVTAYNSGQRITVQEALMVTEQEWYQ
jgi:hypothetical protein